MRDGGSRLLTMQIVALERRFYSTSPRFGTRSAISKNVDRKLTELAESEINLEAEQGEEEWGEEEEEE